MGDSRIAPALAGLALAFVALSPVQAADLDLPSFAHLRERAVESVDITIGALPLFLMRCIVKADDDPESAEQMEVLKGLKSVRVRNYRFDSDFAYSKADLDSVRSQLSGPGWSPLAQVHDRKHNEDVDVYVALKDEKITSLAVIASEPREFTIVYLVGSIDPKKLDKLQGQFHLPETATESMSQYSP